MTTRAVDLEKLRVAFRRMSRGNLLIIAERAIEHVPHDQLQTLVGDFVRLEELTKATPGITSLLGEVRTFHEASMRGDYYESFFVNSKNYMDMSQGTEAFIAELDRLLRTCIRAAEKEPRAPIREAFEVLIGLLRYIDECNDDVIFFADEGGAWQVGVDWHVALPAYFQCLADTASPDDFAYEVDRVIQDFAEHERSRHLTAARHVASAEQEAALDALLAERHRATR